MTLKTKSADQFGRDVQGVSVGAASPKKRAGTHSESSTSVKSRRTMTRSGSHSATAPSRSDQLTVDAHTPRVRPASRKAGTNSADQFKRDAQTMPVGANSESIEALNSINDVARSGSRSATAPFRSDQSTSDAHSVPVRPASRKAGTNSADRHAADVQTMVVGANSESVHALKSNGSMTRGGNRKVVASHSADQSPSDVHTSIVGAPSQSDQFRAVSQAAHVRPGRRKPATNQGETKCAVISGTALSHSSSGDTAAPVRSDQVAYDTQLADVRPRPSRKRNGQPSAAHVMCDVQREHGGTDAGDVQRSVDGQSLHGVAGIPTSAAHISADIQGFAGGTDAGDVQLTADSHLYPDIAGIIRTLVAHYRQYRILEHEEKALTLRLKAICRSLVEGGNKDKAKELHDELTKKFKSGDHQAVIDRDGIGTAHLFQLRETIGFPKDDLEKLMQMLAERLPVWEYWGKDVYGFSSWGLAKLIAEAQSSNPDYPFLSIGNYANPQKLWKRFGLAVIEGQRQQKIAGNEELAERHGYNPSRRSVAWVTIYGAKPPGTIINQQKKALNRGRPENAKYRLIMEKRLAYETECNKAGKYQVQALRILAHAKKNNKKLAPDNRKELEAGRLTESHLKNRARCYAGKMFLKDLWRAWRDTMPAERR